MGKIEDRERLRRLARDRDTPQKEVWHAKIVLLAGEGKRGADEVGMSELTLRR
jgi:hypothetical protein